MMISTKSFEKGQQLTKNFGFFEILYLGRGTAFYTCFFNKCSFLLCHYWNPTVSWFKHAPGTPNKCPMHEFSLELTVNT